jgi:AcrR family transcriptional regulator
MMSRMAAMRRGRPRDPAIGQAILDATRELLLDVGYAGVSMEAVATRAGTTKPTLYRRYPNKGALVFDAVFGKTRAVAMPDSGNLIADLGEAYDWAVAEFAAPEARAALPGLMADVSASPELRQLVQSLVIDPEYARVERLLRNAQARGEIGPEADLTLAIDAFLGTALARASLLDQPLNHADGKRLVELIVSGLAPRSG